MAGKYIYLLWYYAEHGPEGLKATCDRSLLPKLVKSYSDDGWFERCTWKPLEVLAEALKKSDAVLADFDGGYPLMEGWGGLVLQVVKLQESEAVNG